MALTACVKRMRPLLGCFVEIALPLAPDSSVFDEAFARIELIQRLLSFHAVDSELSQLNRAEGQALVCHPLTLNCLRLARAVSRASAGVFNVAMGGQLIAKGVLPGQDYKERYGAALQPVGCWQDLTLTRHTARLCPGVLVCLDGIAKGFAVDAAISLIQAAGVDRGWINAGGDLRVFGDLTLPVHILDHLGQVHYKGGLCNAAIATSTSLASREFPGLLLEGTGRELPPQTLSVIARRAWRADALTKVAAGTPPGQRDELLGRLGGRWVPLT
ncbi:MAG: FAD:protein FMN transferase [Marinagarivorans sp.]